MRYRKQAMIVAPQPEPTEAGADVLREGGNAVDAGIACALVRVRLPGQPPITTSVARSVTVSVDSWLRADSPASNAASEIAPVA